MAIVIVVLIMIGCAVYQYLKGTFVRALSTIIIAVCGGIVAFSFFEFLAEFIISRGKEGSLLFLVPWAQPLCFVLLFVLTFAVLQTAAVQLTQKPVDLGFMPERIGRIVCGIILGFYVSGLLLICLQMGPLPSKFPYQRLDSAKLDPDNPSTVLLNADGFAIGLFNMISNGSFSGKRSFGTVHPDYLNQLFMNRLKNDVSLLSCSPVIEISRPAVWPAPDAVKKQVEDFVTEYNSRGKLVDQDSKKSIPMSSWLRSGYEPIIVRVGLKRSALQADPRVNAAIFSLTQVRLICKRKGYGQDLYAGTAINVFPLGYLNNTNQIQLNPDVQLKGDNFGRNGNKKDFDFVFCIPTDHVPVLVQYKLNNILDISNAIAPADQAFPGSGLDRPSERNEEPANQPERQENTEAPANQDTPPPGAQNTNQGSSLSDVSRNAAGLDLESEDM